MGWEGALDAKCSERVKLKDAEKAGQQVGNKNNGIGEEMEKFQKRVNEEKCERDGEERRGASLQRSQGYNCD